MVVDEILAEHCSMNLANLDKLAGCNHDLQMVVEASQGKDGKNWEPAHSMGVVDEDSADLLGTHYEAEWELEMQNMLALIVQL